MQKRTSTRGTEMEGRRYIGRRGTGTSIWSRCSWIRAKPTSPRRTSANGTALHLAACGDAYGSFRYKDVVALLLDKGADVAATDEFGSAAGETPRGRGRAAGEQK
jgi:hypothetical protein